MRHLIRLALNVAIVLVGLSLGAGDALAQKNCNKGKPCGNSCIARNKTCRIGTTAPAPAAQSGRADSVRPALTTAAGQATAGEWVASSRGRTYYKAGCSGGNKLAKANLIYFKTENEAKAAGLTRSRQKGC